MKKIKIVSPRAELAVIKALCNRDLKIAGTTLSLIDESYFYEPLSKELYHVIKDKFAETASPPSLKLILEDPEVSDDAKQYIRDGASIQVTTAEEANKAVQLLNRFRRIRILYDIGKHISNSFEQSKLNIDSVVNDVVTQINIAQATKSNKDCFVHFGKNDNAKGLLEEIIYGEDTDDIIPTGFQVYDDLSGGFDRGSFVALGATSGGGKSTLATQLCVNMAKLGYKVVLVPLEMSKKEMGNRLLANIGNMELSKIRRHQLDDREKDLLSKRHRRWRKMVFKNGGRFTIFRPEEDLDIDEVYAAISALKCDVCIIDYISLLKGIDDENQWLRLGSIARRAKVNAEITNRVNILLCQVNEDGKIRYAGAIKEHATSAWIWTPSEEDKESGIVRIEQIKSRNSQPFPFSLKFNWNRMQVESIDNSVEAGEPAPVDTKDQQVNLAADI